MKRLFAGVLSLCLTLNTSRTDTTVSADVPAGYATVPPSSLLSFNLTVNGCDAVAVWTILNGVTNALGTLKPPYNMGFTAQSSGTNLVVIEYCNYRGVTATNNFNLISSQRTFPRRLKR